MKLRSLVLFGAGVAAGLAIARKLHEDDPAVLHGPTRGRESANPAVRSLSRQAQRFGDRASVKGVDAIRKAREMIRERLTDQGYDDAAWN